MQTFLASIHRPRDACPVVAAFRALAGGDAELRGHAIVDDPSAADCVLFVDSHLSSDPTMAALLDHPLARRFRERAMVYDERDEPWCTFPGVYVSMPRRGFDSGRQRAFGYYTADAATNFEPAGSPDLLFSFVGSPGHRSSLGHRVRRRLIESLAGDPRGHVEDSSGFVFYDDRGDAAAHRERQRRFGEVVARSKFVLCPRGKGTSSIRMYEAMRAGRVPIVLADEWVAPDGPDWASCSIRLRESDVGRAGDVARESEANWEAMSRAARAAYDAWFARHVAVGRILDLCASLLPCPADGRWRWRDPSYRAMRRRVATQRGRALAGRTLRAVGLR